MKTTSRRAILLMFIAAGLASGAAAVLFHEYVSLARELLLSRALQATGIRRVVMIVSIPALTAAFLGWIVERFAPSVLGAGLARVRRGYAEDVSHLGPRTVVFTFLLTPLSLGSGAPMGPEGPTIIITSGLSVWIARMLKLPRKVVRGMVPVGTAAGIAAIFRTPITGVVFALEELFGTSSRSILGGTLVAAVAAAVVQQAAARGDARILPAGAAVWTHVWELAGFAIVGICAGLVSGAVLRFGARLRDRARRAIRPAPLRFGLAGALVGLLGLLNPAMLGVGYETTSLFLRGGGSMGFATEAFGTKALGFTIAAAAGLLGGTFAPALFIGAALGSAVGFAARLLHAGPIDPGAYALVGMGAYFAGTLRAPIAAVLIVLELTNDYGLMVPLMLGVVVANTISHALAPLTLEEDQLAREGFRLREHTGRDPLAQIAVREAMTADVTTFGPDTTVAELLDHGLRHRMYPVVDDRRQLLGLLARERIGSQSPDVTAGALMEQPRLVAREDESLHDLFARMANADIDRCPVVDSGGAVVGFLSPSDLFRARLREQERIADETLR